MLYLLFIFYAPVAHAECMNLIAESEVNAVKTRACNQKKEACICYDGVDLDYSEYDFVTKTFRLNQQKKEDKEKRKRDRVADLMRLEELRSEVQKRDLNLSEISEKMRLEIRL